MKLDRTVAPPLHAIDTLHINPLEQYSLSNGLQVHVLEMNQDEIVLLHLHINGGDLYENKKLAARFTARLLRDGTTKHTSQQIAEFFDSFGAEVSSYHSAESIVIGLQCLSEHFVSILPMLTEILTEAIFPSQELVLAKSQTNEWLKLQTEKTSYLAALQLRKMIYGEMHAYTDNLNTIDIEKLEDHDLRTHYQQYFSPNNSWLLLGGKIDQTIKDACESFLGNSAWKQSTIFPFKNTAILPSTEKKYRYEKKDAVQCSIRIGSKTIKRTHPDADLLIFTNTLLGGYFGSRLMSNLREDKGYTYGIHSSVSFNLDHGLVKISTEVGKEVAEKAANEIYKEIEILQNQLVGVEELELVKNYMMGNSLSSSDGILQQFTLHANLLSQKRTLSQFLTSVKRYNEVTANEILDIAQRYYDTSHLYEVIVG